MFEGVKLIGSTEVSVALETRKKRQIENSQAADVSWIDLQRFERLLRNKQTWELRKAPCGIYNCFGHVWASRRTAIIEDEAIQRILTDDGYRKLRNHEGPLQGDIAIYSVPESRSILHVGIVSELRKVVGGGQESKDPTCYILSKWSPTSGEVLHHFRDHPYDFEPDITFWTERP